MAIATIARKEGEGVFVLDASCRGGSRRWRDSDRCGACADRVWASSGGDHSGRIKTPGHCAARGLEPATQGRPDGRNFVRSARNGTLSQNGMLVSTGHAPPLASLLSSYPQAANVLFVGHQPDIGMLVTQVLGFELGFGTATIAAFESRSPSEWHFLWTHTPEDLLKKR